MICMCAWFVILCGLLVHSPSKSTWHTILLVHVNPLDTYKHESMEKGVSDFCCRKVMTHSSFMQSDISTSCVLFAQENTQFRFIPFNSAIVFANVLCSFDQEIARFVFPFFCHEFKIITFSPALLNVNVRGTNVFTCTIPQSWNIFPNDSVAVISLFANIMWWLFNVHQVPQPTFIYTNLY